MRWGRRELLAVGAVAAAAAAVTAAAVAGCQGNSLPIFGASSQSDASPTGPCPPRAAASTPLPGVTGEQRTLAYWLERVAEPDAVVLSVDDIARHNAALAAEAAAHPEAEPRGHFDLLGPERKELLEKEIRERLAYVRSRAEDGSYVDRDGKPLGAEATAALAEPSGIPAPGDELRVAVAAIPLRCVPLNQGIYKAPEVDEAFDRNMCSTIRAQEPVRILGTWAGGMRLVRARYTLGWIAPDAPLSPALGAEDRRAFATGSQLRAHGKLTLRDERGRDHEIDDKTLLVAAGEGKARFASADGVHTSQALEPSQAAETSRPLTRRTLLQEAFSYLDTPYAWGGRGGGRDCSRFLMDVLGAFGLHLPRHSGNQARAGSMTIDISGARTEADRLAIIDAAASRGVVLLHFPGHIMLYLGRSAEGTPMVMHAFAEYVESCSTPPGDAGSGETLRTVDRVQVSDLSLGKGTSRRSFLERITQVVVLGKTPGVALAGAVERRPPAPILAPPDTCQGDDDVVLEISPDRPHPGAPLRVIVSAEDDLGAVEITLFGPDGARHAPELHRVGGPPFGYWAEVGEPAAGSWTAAVGEGDRTEACSRFSVYEEGAKRRASGAFVWQPKRRWNRATENLYATFVEQLFDYPLDDRTWPSLQEVLVQRDRNILYDHLGQGEDEQLGLRPDCADLPYFLRAYFSWKMRLPFAYRHCNRGFEGKAPYCDRDTHDHLKSVEAATEVAAFSTFARDNIANGVHSGSGRTGPADDYTDYYPLPLTREAIRPGAIFADPYGHLFVIASWKPQGADSYGILVGADAQPDGTVGRRRFWPGSFLFTPDTSEAGAGFKAFRPARYRGGRITQYKNADIEGLGLPPFSMAQYEGTKDDFYDRVEALINPRPLDPKAMQDVLVTALFEQLKRRVVSVQNGEEYKQGRGAAIDMPQGHAIFETTGAWENYSTPSRDMRLLIAIDTVLGFPAAVERRPERFGLASGQVEASLAELRRYLDEQLKANRFSYVRSDGASQPLSLRDVVDRKTGFEMAYNPNDCVEIRWAAPEGSAERASCRQHAPAHQQRLMERYRSWFAERKRPAR